MEPTTLILLISAIWVVSGPPGLMLDWTRTFDLTVGDAAICILIGAVLGPFSWVVLWTSGKSFGSGRILMRRRK